MKRTRALLTTALPAALVAALALTGCTAGSDTGTTKGTDGQECAPSGKTSDSVKLDGKLGGELKLDAKTPLAVKSLERTVAIKGDGEAVAKGRSAVTQLTVFNGKTGETIAPATSTPIANDSKKVAPWAAKAVACATIGDRVVVVTPVSEVLGAGGGASYKMEDADALIAVFDFMKLAPKPMERAEGKAVDAPAGLPTVKLDDNGKPTITIPKGEKAPSKLEVAPLIEGTGETVAETDSVTLHYTGVVWSNGKQFDSSWDRGEPITSPANGFVKGFTQAIVGKKVGSQIIAVIPADLGYGKDTATRLSSAGAKKDDVMVFVIDILATSKTQ